MFTHEFALFLLHLGIAITYLLTVLK